MLSALGLIFRNFVWVQTIATLSICFVFFCWLSGSTLFHCWIFSDQFTLKFTIVVHGANVPATKANYFKLMKKHNICL